MRAKRARRRASRLVDPDCPGEACLDSAKTIGVNTNANSLCKNLFFESLTAVMFLKIS
jgi:hypothetical protein